MPIHDRPINKPSASASTNTVSGNQRWPGRNAARSRSLIGAFGERGFDGGVGSVMLAMRGEVAVNRSYARKANRGQIAAWSFHQR